MQFPNIYAKPYYKYYMLISLVILIAALAQIPNLRYGIDLQGGMQLMASMDTAAPTGIEEHLAQYDLQDLSVRFITNPLNNKQGVEIQFAGTPDLIKAESIVASDPAQAKALAARFSKTNFTESMTAREAVELAKADFIKTIQTDMVAFLGVNPDQVSSTEIGAALGKEFWETSQRALALAFVLIAAIVFIMFREPVPSIAVLQAAIYDVLIALGGMAYFHIPLTLPTIAGVLMILGHSVDTDILTTDRVLKRTEGSAADRAFGAMKTGITMTGTILVVLMVLVLFSYFNQMTTLFQISAVLMFGLIGDLPSSWCTNTVMIKWWAEHKEKSKN